MTNGIVGQITESPEKLAEWLDIIRDNCGNNPDCPSCPLGKAKHCYGEDLVEWLQEECE